MKRAQRHQKGYIYPKGSNWYLRYYNPELQADGTTKQVQRCRPLVEYGGKYRSKVQREVLADEFLAPLNSGKMSAASTMTLNALVREALPAVLSKPPGDQHVRRLQELVQSPHPEARRYSASGCAHVGRLNGC